MAIGKIIIEMTDEGTSVGIEIEEARAREILGAYRHVTKSIAELLNSPTSNSVPELSLKKQIIAGLHMACTDGIDDWIDEASDEEESEKHES